MKKCLCNISEQMKDTARLCTDKLCDMKAPIIKSNANMSAQLFCPSKKEPVMTLKINDEYNICVLEIIIASLAIGGIAFLMKIKRRMEINSAVKEAIKKERLETVKKAK